MKTFANLLESILWNVRLLITLPVLVSLVVAVGVLIVTTVDAIILLGNVVSYMGLDDTTRSAVRLQTISEVVSIVDGYLLTAILIIFALGLYELFVSKIDAAEGSELAGRLLLIRSLDDLKDRLSNVILVILIVKFFQQALTMKFEAPLDLLALALGVFLIGAALFMTSRAKSSKKTDNDIVST